MMRTRILIVDPDPTILASMLRSPEFEVIEATGERAALRMLESANPPGLVIHAVDPDRPDALELLASVRRERPETSVVLLFAASHPGRYTRALHMGARTVLIAPVPANRLRAAVAQALETVGRAGRTGVDAGRAPHRGAGEARPEGEAPRRPRSGDRSVPVACTCHPEAVHAAPSTTLIVQAGTPLGPLKEALEGPEREIIARALRALGGNRRETARVLEIDRTTLYKKMKKYGLLNEGDGQETIR